VVAHSVASIVNYRPFSATRCPSRLVSLFLASRWYWKYLNPEPSESHPSPFSGALSSLGSCFQPATAGLFGLRSSRTVVPVPGQRRVPSLQTRTVVLRLYSVAPKTCEAVLSKTGSPHRQLRHLSLCDQQTAFVSSRLVLCGSALSKLFPSNDTPHSRLGTTVTSSQQAVQADQPRQDHRLTSLPWNLTRYTNRAPLAPCRTPA
jgi:hypothetical protein